MSGRDISDDLISQVVQAVDRRQPLQIRGGNSKAFYGREMQKDLETIDLEPHSGVVNYEPTELVLTARAGTPVSVVNEVLAASGQCLPFEPPGLGGQATIGGTIACGLSGPARPYAGSARDYVLGMHIINGRGEYLRVGGEVMKNVAGYDVSRLMVGALGTLGIITQVSFKVLPSAPIQCTLSFHLERDSALEFMNELASRPLPVTATCFYEDIVLVRLAGSESGVRFAREQLGGELVSVNDEIWESLREWRHPFFQTSSPLWRIALPALAMPEVEGEVLIEWGGGQWWLQTEMAANEVRRAVTRVGGHATLFRGGDRQSSVFQPLPAGLAKLHKRVATAFDPFGILNPGRQYEMDEIA